MGIRFKLLWPIVIGVFIVGAVVQYYWLPSYLSFAKEAAIKNEKAYLQVLSTSLQSTILTQDFAELSDVLDEVRIIRPQWDAIIVRDELGTAIYPGGDSIIDLAVRSPQEKVETVALTSKINVAGIEAGTLDVTVNLNTILEKQRQFVSDLELIMILVVALIALLAAVIQDRFLVKPLTALTNVAEKISRGNFDMPLSSRSRDEIGQLINSFDSMRRELQSRDKDLHLQNSLLDSIRNAQAKYIVSESWVESIGEILDQIKKVTEARCTAILDIESTIQSGFDTTKALMLGSGKGTDYKLTEIKITRSFWGKVKSCVSQNGFVRYHIESLDVFPGQTLDSFPGLTSVLLVPLHELSGRCRILLVGYYSDENADLNDRLLQPMVFTIENILRTEQNRLEREEAEQEKGQAALRTQSIVNAVVDGVVSFDQDAVIELANPATERMFSLSEKRLVGSKITSLFDGRAAKEIYHFLESKSGSLHVCIGEKESYWLAKKSSGYLFPVELFLSTIKFGGKTSYVAVIRDITERKKVENMKTEFVSTVSHELRTPLTSIKGALGLLNGDPQNQLNASSKMLIDVAERNADRLVSLINDILDIEKIEAGQLEFNFEICDINKIVEKAVLENASFASQYRVNIHQSLMDQAVSVNVDQSRIRQVVDNLLSNAIKYSPEDSLVTLKTELVNGNVRVSITDQGPGIPETFWPQLFSKFTQYDSSDTRKKGGTGLGLSICKKIIEQHNAVLNFESELGKGTVFYFDLDNQDTKVHTII